VEQREYKFFEVSTLKSIGGCPSFTLTSITFISQLQMKKIVHFWNYKKNKTCSQNFNTIQNLYKSLSRDLQTYTSLHHIMKKEENPNSLSYVKGPHQPMSKPYGY